MKHLKLSQKTFVNNQFASAQVIEYERNFFHDYFRAIPFKATHRLLKKAGITLNGSRILVASCGSGIDIHYLGKYYKANWVASDIAVNAVSYTCKAIPEISGLAADTEQLPFPDAVFDYAFIAASLHHFPRPQIALYELLRVARYGVIVIEPNDNPLTRLATRLGLAQEYEVSGNYVYRQSPREIRKIAKAMNAKVFTAGCFASHHITKTKAGFVFLRLTNTIANIVAPGLGNYLIFMLLQNRSADIIHK